IKLIKLVKDNKKFLKISEKLYDKFKNKANRKHPK
ncbi:hypothetical protein LCGC14_0590930, partial [marine sediment metagenome]